MVALVGVLLLGILRGVLLTAFVSLVMLLRAGMYPHVALLGRIPGTTRYSDMERNADNQSVPGALLLRVEASILYLNAEHVRDEVRRRLRAAGTVPRAVVIDLSSSPSVDVTGALMLSGLQRELAATGIELRLVEARASARDLLRAGGLDARVGEISHRASVHEIVNQLTATAERPRS
jgi:MFS superfamily sulfate permease-like transporter